MAERCPVQTSAVFLLGQQSQFPAVPPPSPPSPVTPGNEDLCTTIEELSLDAVDAPVTAAAVVPGIPGVTTAGCPASVVAVPPGILNKTPPANPAETPSASPPATAPASAPESPQLAPSLAGSAISSSLSSWPLAASSGATVSDRLAGAVHVLATEAAALQSVAQLYATSSAARDGFDQAVEAIVRTQTAQPPGKLVVVGVGKSGHIGRKLAATFNSLAVPASFLHPTEALHGDLGHIRAHDALLFITYSGKTHELVSLLPHVDPALPLIILTAHVTAETCELVRHRNEHQQRHAAAVPPTTTMTTTTTTILLPAPIPVEEKVAFGVAAPTASTTTALAVGDALAIVASKEMHPSTETVFRRNHPGGAIGEAFRQPAPVAHNNDEIRHLSVPWRDIPIVCASSSSSLHPASAACADVLRAGYGSTAGWVRVVDSGGDNGLDGVAPPSRIRALRSADLAQPVHTVPGLVVGRADFVAVAADTKARSAAEWLQSASASASASMGSEGEQDVVVAIMEHGEIVGVLELQDLLKVHWDRKKALA